MGRAGIFYFWIAPRSKIKVNELLFSRIYNILFQQFTSPAGKIEITKVERKLNSV